MRVEQGFQQTPAPPTHPYSDDRFLVSLLRNLLPPELFTFLDAEFVRFGDELLKRLARLRVVRIVTHEASDDKEWTSTVSPPTLTQYDQWGGRIDKLSTSEGWRNAKDFATREGLVAISYERKEGEWSRLHATVKLLFFASYSHSVNCPLAMTDGAARVLELIGTPEMQSVILPRLLSRDPRTSYTSGQWMTERPGGSDISQIETTAKLLRASPTGPAYSLDGFKWFSSATDANVALALARTATKEQGSRGLSLFLVPVSPLFHPSFPPRSIASPSSQDTTESRNGITIHRLKHKLGTTTLPTAELSLQDTTGYLLGPLNGGVKSITPLLNITRVYSATASIGYLSRALAIAKSYSGVRAINGGRQLLKENALHNSTLAKVEVLYRALLSFLFGVVHLLGKSEVGTASTAEGDLLRLFTPVLKGFAAHTACGGMEECMAALGGQGYMEENVIPRLIRDGLVEKIWEGTINVLGLDLLRSSNKKSVDSLKKWFDSVFQRAESIKVDSDNNLKAQISQLTSSIHKILIPSLLDPAPESARAVLLHLGYAVSATYLLEHAIRSLERTRQGSGWKLDFVCFSRWVEEGRVFVVGDAYNRRVGGDDSNRVLLYGKL